MLTSMALQIDAWCKAITYKPNFTIEFFEDHRHSYFIIKMDVPDSTIDEEIPPTVKVQQWSVIPPYDLTQDQFNDFVFREILRLERHEAQEWFKIDGKLWNDPHAHDRRA